MPMIYLNKSKLSGKEGSMEFNITPEEFRACFARWMNGELIQKAFPMLSPEEREFIMNGITPEEWDDVFGQFEHDKE